MTPKEPPIMDRLTKEMEVSPSKRVSWRLRGEDPAVDTGILEFDDIGNQKLSKELKLLMTKGKEGGHWIILKTGNSFHQENSAA